MWRGKVVSEDKALYVFGIFKSKKYVTGHWVKSKIVFGIFSKDYTSHTAQMKMKAESQQFFQEAKLNKILLNLLRFSVSEMKN